MSDVYGVRIAVHSLIAVTAGAALAVCAASIGLLAMVSGIASKHLSGFSHFWNTTPARLLHLLCLASSAEPVAYAAVWRVAAAYRILDVLSSSRFLVTVSSLHLFNLALCLLLFVATKEHRDRLARQAGARSAGVQGTKSYACSGSPVLLRGLLRSNPHPRRRLWDSGWGPPGLDAFRHCWACKQDLPVGFNAYEEPCTPPGWEAKLSHRVFPAPAAACGLPSPFGCMPAPAAAKAGASMPPSCTAGPWRAAVACSWPAERTTASTAHGRPMRSLFKSHYARPSAAPALRRAASLPLACTEVDVTFRTAYAAPAPLVSAPRVLQPLRTSRSVPPLRVRCPPCLPGSASLPMQLQAPVPVTAERGPCEVACSVGRSGSASVPSFRGSGSLPPPAPRCAATGPGVPKRVRRAVMDDVLDDLLVSAVARLMTASEGRPVLARRAQSAPAASTLDECELWMAD